MKCNNCQRTVCERGPCDDVCKDWCHGADRGCSHIHERFNCELTYCAVCVVAMRRCELSENLMCRPCTVESIKAVLREYKKYEEECEEKGNSDLETLWSFADDFRDAVEFLIK